MKTLQLLIISTLTIIILGNCGKSSGQYKIVLCSEVNKQGGCDESYTRTTFSNSSTMYIEIRNPNQLTNKMMILAFYDKNNKNEWNTVDTTDINIYKIFEQRGMKIKKDQYPQWFTLNPIKISDIVESGTKEGEFKLELIDPSNKNVLGSTKFVVK